MSSENHKRHSWISWDGKAIKVKAKCTRCGCMRKATTGKTTYYLDGKSYDKSPTCTT